jgi:hypothetical protein
MRNRSALGSAPAEHASVEGDTIMAEETIKADAPAAADMYHDHKKALDWALRLETIAWIPLVLAIVALAFLGLELYVYIPQVIGSAFVDAVLGLGITVLLPLAAAVMGVSIFVLLRAASQALLVLLDIQEGPSAS